MPKVCLDCRYLKPAPSGIAQMIGALMAHLPALAPDWQFVFLRHTQAQSRSQSSQAGSQYSAPNVTPTNVTEIALAGETNGPGTMFWLKHLLDLEPLDLFHAPANILPHGLPMPSLATIHDCLWLTHPQLCNNSLWGRLVERPFYRHGINRSIDMATRIVAVSEASRQAILATRPGEVSNHSANHPANHQPSPDNLPPLAQRIKVISHGVSPEFVPHILSGDEVGALGQRLGLPDKVVHGRFFLTIGQYAPYKNHEGALRGFALAFAGRDDVALVMVQRQGPATGKLKRMAQQLRVEGQVHFLPAVDQSCVHGLYQQATGLLHPSFAEGFGMPLAEAMASGCPVVTSNCSAMPEVTAGAALLVDPHDPGTIADALMTLSEDGAARARLSQQGLARASELDWEQCARLYLQTYREILAIGP